MDVDVVECGNECVDDEDHPQVALGVGLPFLSSIEESEHEDEQHREHETGQMERVISQWGWKENVAQQDCHSHTQRRPVVELLCGDAQVEEIHPHHHQTGDVEHVEYQFGPGFRQSEVKDPVDHDAHREYGGNGGDTDVEDFSFLAESCFHIIVLCNRCSVCKDNK